MKLRHNLVLFIPFLVNLVGVVANAAVVRANHGQMPVHVPNVACSAIKFDIAHTCMTAQTHLNYLADIFTTSQSIQSFGDLTQQFADAPVLVVACFLTWCGFLVNHLKGAQ